MLTGDKAPLSERDPNLLLRLELAESLRCSVSDKLRVLASLPVIRSCDGFPSHLRANDMPAVAVVLEAVNVPSVSGVDVDSSGTGVRSVINGFSA